MEWGYMDAYLDKDGYFGDLTLKSINEFRTAHGIESNLPLDAETFSAIFEGDTNVNVVID
jgi:peptidoglycan hydrolase-like protein with peptidoglycan-binding domain